MFGHFFLLTQRRRPLHYADLSAQRPDKDRFEIAKIGPKNSEKYRG